ncbi:MAG: hypothetical protein R2940_14445 [Syntrophotaleaceae bacterium]
MNGIEAEKIIDIIERIVVIQVERHAGFSIAEAVGLSRKGKNIQSVDDVLDFPRLKGHVESQSFLIGGSPGDCQLDRPEPELFPDIARLEVLYHGCAEYHRVIGIMPRHTGVEETGILEIRFVKGRFTKVLKRIDDEVTKTYQKKYG